MLFLFLLVAGCYMFDVGCWLFVVGCQVLDDDCSLLVACFTLNIIRFFVDHCLLFFVKLEALRLEACLYVPGGVWGKLKSFKWWATELWWCLPLVDREQALVDLGTGVRQ